MIWAVGYRYNAYAMQRQPLDCVLLPRRVGSRVIMVLHYLGAW